MSERATRPVHRELPRTLSEVLLEEEILSTETLHSIFDSLDTDGSGKLSIEELERGASHLFIAGVSLPRIKIRGSIREHTAREFLRRADLDGDELLSREEFVGGIRRQECVASDIEHMRRLPACLSLTRLATC